MWGGHPGTTARAFSINGSPAYHIPDPSPAEKNCTYSYPEVMIDPAQLRTGSNIVQFSCEKGRSFWGHFILDNTCLRLALKPDAELLASRKLAAFEGGILATRDASQPELIKLALACPPGYTGHIASVEYQGYYKGFDENGNGLWQDWHGFTKYRQPEGVIAVATNPPFSTEWDVSMIPDQGEAMRVRARLRFTGVKDLYYETPAMEGITIPGRTDAVVSLVHPDKPRSHWSRNWSTQECVLVVGPPPGQIERTQLHVCIWDGGKGSIAEPFTLNGHPLEIAGSGRHDLLYRVVDVPPDVLRAGTNTIQLVSDTEHHGIEVCYPGYAIVIRTRSQ
jgi:hypothetical protein